MKATTTKKTSTPAKQRRKATVEGKSRARPNLKRTVNALPKTNTRSNSSTKKVRSQAKLPDTKSNRLLPVRQELLRQLKPHYFELTIMLQVAIFIGGVWLHHFLINILFGKEQPYVLTTMVPGLEWIMIGFIIRKALNSPNHPKKNRRESGEEIVSHSL